MAGGTVAKEVPRARDLQGTDPGNVDLTPRQLPLSAATDQLTSMIDENNSGYAGIVVSPKQGTVRLYWHGRAPARITHRVAELNNPWREVTIISARYTFRQLQDEADRLMRVDRGIVRVGMNSDGSGLRVTLNQALRGKHPRHVDSTIANTVTWGAPLSPLPFRPHVRPGRSG
ncbi:MAG TPA: hypothetical protein VFX70_07355 [Mycobacteriales bacterium]|nr:hypothetical protein [Mycobacteriales bacterium]